MLNIPIPITQHHLDENTDQLVSISCLTYNHENFIREYKAKFPHLFNVFLQSENTYGKTIRKKALEPYQQAHFKSKYIAFCEGDDYWTDPLKLQKQVDFLEQNKEYGLVYTDIDRIDEGGNIIDKGFLKNESANFSQTFEDYLLHTPFRAPCTWLYKRSLYKLREKEYVVGDFPLLLDIAAQSKNYFLNDTTANYRILTKSASHFTNLKHTYTFMKGVFEIQMDYAQKYNMCEDIIEAIKIKHALVSYNFAVSQDDISQIKRADRLLIGNPNATYKFKVIQLLSKFKVGRQLVKLRLNRLLGYT